MAKLITPLCILFVVCGAQRLSYSTVRQNVISTKTSSSSRMTTKSNGVITAGAGAPKTIENFESNFTSSGDASYTEIFTKMDDDGQIHVRTEHGRVSTRSSFP